MLEENFGMNKYNYKKQLMRLTEKDLLGKMLVEVDMISMYMYIQVQEHIFVEKNQL
jgi:hypothetical protein